MADWVELEWHDTRDLEDGPDYIAYHDGKGVARVYSDHVRDVGTIWKWFVWWYATPNSGHTDSRREAFLEVERLYNLYVGSTK